MTAIYSGLQPIIIITAKVTIRMGTAVVCAYLDARMPVCVCLHIRELRVSERVCMCVSGLS